ncbi:hypothetical protein M569_01972 [Genlisea aurea]|uniref:Homeobox domain-containing protein n=1 Tax=Genlisea aurea TaxID=192259 RepID=S8D5T8_9LAMI|nr:hypothetical protein M569_01972 [Genlisea aurea]
MTMGFDGGKDSLAGRRLRPLMPRPSNHGCDFLPRLGAAIVEQNGKARELVNSQQVVVSSRWNPTPEQLQTLEELYRRGTRTPSADQIQQITAELRRFGKIEGKNVFYWFQNHKARERLKRRRQMDQHSPEKGEQQQITGQIPEIRNRNPKSAHDLFRIHD